ncbi:hypothetical protein HK105_207872 [Polyrhizophydium stewartii]|uniref:Ankyrin repeat protein n=1 Tax=Polyrhizophydium stewartii TaxID=2732419 RepID=A0ABR4MZF5_9FUNG
MPTTPDIAPASALPALHSRGPAARSVADLFRGLPLELRRMILRLAGPFTELLHDELAWPLTLETVRLAIADTLALDSVDGLQQLACRLPEPLSWELALVRSKAALEAVTALFACKEQHVAVVWSKTGSPKQALVALRLAAATGPLSAAQQRLLGRRLDELVRGGAVARVRAGEDAGDLLAAAAAFGRLDVIENLMPLAAQPSSLVFELAGLHGHMHVVQFLCDNGLAASAVLDGAISGGNADLLRLLVPFAGRSPRRTGWRDDWARPALDARRPAALLALLQLNPPCTTSWAAKQIAVDAARNGLLDVVVFAVERLPDQDLNSAANAAAAGGHVHVLEWLKAARGIQLSQPALDAAVAGNQLEAVDWILANTRVKPCVSTVDAAVRSGLVELAVRMRQAAEADPSDDALRWAAFQGHIAIVERFLGAGGGMLTDGRRRRLVDDLLVEAVLGGQLGVAEWLVDRRGAAVSQRALDALAGGVGPASQDRSDRAAAEAIGPPASTMAFLHKSVGTSSVSATKTPMH